MADLFCPTIKPDVEAKFWFRVDKSFGQGPDGNCWCWTGPLLPMPCNYPNGFAIKHDGKTQQYRPSHVALALIGKFRSSRDQIALHSCDNKPCVNPAHLRWGTMADNVQDHIERTKKAAFTDEQIRYVRSSPLRHYLIAREFGVASSCIYNIRTRTSYKHVT